MTAGPSESARPAVGVSRAVMAALAVLVASVTLAVVAPTAHAQQDDAESVDTEVTTRGVTDLCVIGETDECADVGRNVDGVLEAVMAGAGDDGQADIGSCPEGQTGVVITLSNLGSDATVTASLTGEAEQNGETQEIDESVGPVGATSAGQATVTVCGSAEGGEQPPELGDPVDPGEPDPGEPDPGEPGPGGVLDLVTRVLEAVGLGDLFDPGDLPADPGDLPEDPTDGQPEDPTEQLPEGEDPTEQLPEDPTEQLPEEDPTEQLPEGEDPTEQLPEDPTEQLPEGEDPTEQLPQELPDELPVDPGEGPPEDPGDGVPEDPGDGAPEDPGDGAPEDPRDDAPDGPGDTPGGGDSPGEAGAEADGGASADSDGNADAGGSTRVNGGTQDDGNSGSSDDSDEADGFEFDSDDVLGG